MSTAPQQLDPAFEQLVARNDELMVENESLVAENDRLREIARLAERFARARGRYHSQNAAYDLMEAFNLPRWRDRNQRDLRTACLPQLGKRRGPRTR